MDLGEVLDNFYWSAEECEILSRLGEEYKIPKKELTELYGYLRAMALYSHNGYDSRWASDQLIDVERAMRDRGLLVDGEIKSLELPAPE